MEIRHFVDCVVGVKQPLDEAVNLAEGSMDGNDFNLIANKILCELTPVYNSIEIKLFKWALGIYRTLANFL